jgi:hypothetical protein
LLQPAPLDLKSVTMRLGNCDLRTPQRRAFRPQPARQYKFIAETKKRLPPTDNMSAIRTLLSYNGRDDEYVSSAAIRCA